MADSLFDLTGTVALVTGGSRGLGRAMAAALGRAGASLALCARNTGDLAEAREELAAGGARVETFPMDVLDPGSVQAAVDGALAALGRIDILVNDAGVNVRKPVLELSVEDWDRVLDTNLKGTFLVTRAVVPQMLARGRGKVIHVSSILGTVALPLQVAYASSKGGVAQMTRVMALEWARQGVQVNAIAPTYFETALTEPLRRDPERNRFIVDRTPMGRRGKIDELDGTVVYLASRASDFVTGQIIHVDGGWTAW